MTQCNCSCRHCSSGAHCGQGEIREADERHNAIFCHVEIERDLTVTPMTSSNAPIWNVTPTEYDNEFPGAEPSDIIGSREFEVIIQKRRLCTIFKYDFNDDLTARYRRACAWKEILHPGILVTLQKRIAASTAEAIASLTSEFAKKRDGKISRKFKAVIQACELPENFPLNARNP